MLDELLSLAFNAKSYAIDSHQNTNHRYDDHSYTYHLNMVAEFAEKFIDIELNIYKHEDFIKKLEHVTNVLAAAWCHDLIEDARQTYNDVKNHTNEKVADIVFALTTEKGKTRQERANEKYYNEMKKVPGAVYIKICDRIANMTHAKKSKSGMFEKYCKEYSEFKNKLYDDKYHYMFNYIEVHLIAH